MANDTLTARKPVSPAQQSYLTNLLAKITSEPVRTALQADLNSLYEARLLDTREASRQIDRLKAIVSAQAVAAAPAVVEAPAVVVPSAPVAPAQQPFPVVAAGRYAVVFEGVLRFYNVTRKVSGRTEIKRYSSDELLTLRMYEVVRVLRLIEADPATAQMTYARETTRCFTCGRKLTDADSRERGQGSDCASRNG